MEVVAVVDAPSSPALAAAALPASPYRCSPSPAGAVTPPPKVRPRSPLPSPLRVPGGCSLQELLLLSPPPPGSRRHRSRTRAAGLDDSLEAVPGTPTPPRRRRRGAGEQRAATALASPRNPRRARRRLEKEVEVEEDASASAAARKARRRRSTRAAAPKAAPVHVVAGKAAAEMGEDTTLALVPARSDAASDAVTGFVEHSGWEGLWERSVELVMWRNVAKSALWFGCGSMFFFSLTCSREMTFSPISALCHLGIMIMGLAFFKDSLPQRPQAERGRGFQLTEEDVLRASRALLPVVNSMISTTQVIFSGEPLMTLKVLPVLLFGAKYGSLVTVWRLLAAGFFTGFTVPKIYSCYSSQIHNRVEILRDRILEAWKSCPRKKLVAATAVTMCWNMFSVKTRFMAAFISLVVLRYNQKYRKGDMNMEVEGCQEGQEQDMEVDD